MQAIVRKRCSGSKRQKERKAIRCGKEGRAGYCQQQMFGVRAIVSKRCLGGKRQKVRKAARCGMGYCQQDTFGCGLLSARGDQGAGYCQQAVFRMVKGSKSGVGGGEMSGS